MAGGNALKLHLSLTDSEPEVVFQDSKMLAVRKRIDLQFLPSGRFADLTDAARPTSKI
jgi:hypothetical protein